MHRPSKTDIIPDAVQTPTRILLVDDDRRFCRLLQEYLHPMGFEVDLAHSGGDGLGLLAQGAYQAVILDVMMPGMDGIAVLGCIRRTTDVPVLMLTALGDETDRIVGLEMGADDYVPKTFSTRELLARLRAVLRRHKAAACRCAPKVDAQTLCAGALCLKPASRTARLGGVDLKLTALEFDLLVALVKSAGRVLSRDQLLNAVAGRNCEVFDRSVDVHISSLRKKLGDDPRAPVFIKTVRSVGYMFQHSGDLER